MSRVLLLTLMSVLVTACGIKRPLVAPKDIPAFEEDLKRKRERLQEQEDNVTKANTPDSGQQAAPVAGTNQ